MSQEVNSFLTTYVETIKRYIRAHAANADDNEMTFLKEDVDYFWSKLSAEERTEANLRVREFNYQYDRERATIDLDEIEQ